MVTERGDSLPVHEKARAEGLVTDARQALREEAPIERIRPITAELQAIYHVLSASPAEDPAGPARPDGAADPEDRIAELEDLRRRALADLDNVRKRCAAQITRVEAETRAAVAREWLP